MNHMAPITINLGSENLVKKEALVEVIKDYDFLANATVATKRVQSFVSSQPLSLTEIITGATNRAKQAYDNCDYSFGIESGLMQVLQTKTGYMELAVCAAYDSRNISLGFSQSFECPQKVIDEVLKGKDLEEACTATGLTTNNKIGEAEGIIGILTKGRVTRKDYTKQAIRMALIQLENSRLYL